MTKKFMLLYATITVILVGCFSTKQNTTAIQRLPAKFDFAPPSRAAAGAANLTIALIKPRFIGENSEYFVPPFNEMALAMSNDFEELLSAKGFTMRGPFGSRDEMVYNDKVNSSFAIEINIDLNPQYNRKYKENTTFGSILSSQLGKNYTLTGEVTLGGNLVITASSPQYGEKIWKKNIALDRKTFTYVGSVKWSEIPSMADELKQDNEVYNTLSRELEKYYSQALNLAWQQIDVTEMRNVATEAKKADKRGN